MSAGAEPSDLFLGLVASLQASAWMQLGKIMNPLSGKVERDLDRAQETIDLLGVIQEKTRGNLHPDEARLLEQILFELRMNYVEERKQAVPQAAAPESTSSGSASTEPPRNESANSAAASTDSAGDSTGTSPSTGSTEPS
jgi:Domain of unknown function (DUF1844)